MSILQTGLPRTSLGGVRVTAQPSLAVYEGNAAGVWTWNTWLPAYLTAASFAVFGRTPFAARLPFALAALLALWLSWRLFTDDMSKSPWAAEAGLALLALSPAFILFSRQSRYYALTALGTVFVLHSWRRLLADKRGGALAVVVSLQILLHSSFAFFAVALMVLAADAALRFDECRCGARFWKVAAATVVFSVPVFWYFRVWDRPGNHSYGLGESFEFLKTFLLWISLFALPAFLPAAAMFKRRKPLLVLAGFLILCGLVAEGPWSRVSALLAFVWIVAQGFREPAPRGVMSLCRMSWLWLAATLGLLSLSAAEPYGRYLMGIFPVLAYIGGGWLSEAAGGRAGVTLALSACLLATNWLGWIPLKAASLLAAPSEPAQSVSGMMRQRLRDVKPRSDLARLAGELIRGPEGYIEHAAAAIKAGGGGTVFSDADNLSLIFAAGISPVYADELSNLKPDWLLPSPWLRLDSQTALNVSALSSSGLYDIVSIPVPRLMWQNNPDPLFRNFAPEFSPLPLFHRKGHGPAR